MIKPWLRSQFRVFLIRYVFIYDILSLFGRRVFGLCIYWLSLFSLGELGNFQVLWRNPCPPSAQPTPFCPQVGMQTLHFISCTSAQFCISCFFTRWNKNQWKLISNLKKKKKSYMSSYVIVNKCFIRFHLILLCVVLSLWLLTVEIFYFFGKIPLLKITCQLS